MPRAEVIAHPSVVVISDLHVGDPAPDPDPRRSSLEDFDRDADFARLLDEVIPSTVARRATLVIAGDFIDFAQVLPELGRHELGDRFGVTEQDSVAKLQRVVRGHPAVFAAMRRYIERGGQILILPGNHDIDLHWPAVQAALAAALGDPRPESYRFVERGVIDEHGLYIEHGNQYTYDNRFEHWSHPILDAPDRQKRLERPWGTLFMDLVYNDLEAAYPFINKVYPHSRLAWIAIRGLRDDQRVSVTALARLVAFFATRGKRMLAEHIFLGGAGEAPPPDAVATIAAVLGNAAGAADPDRVAAIARHALRLAEQAPPVDGAAAPLDGRWLMGRHDSGALWERAQQLLEGGDTQIVVFGHTHSAIDGNAKPEYGSRDRRRWFNTGSWTPSSPLTGDERWGELAATPWQHQLHYLVVDLASCTAELRALPATPATPDPARPR